MKIGFIGLGNMGQGIARNLLKAGHEVIVYNRTRNRAEPLLAEGASLADTPSQACQAAVVFSMLADDRAIEEVFFGPGGALSALPKSSIHVSLSTISVALSRRLAEAHAAAESG